MRDGWERKVRPSAAWRPCSGEIAIAYIEGIVVYSTAAQGYIPAAVPSGGPGGTLPSGHARKYSSCHYPQANLIV